jgi:hypothetical protein
MFSASNSSRLNLLGFASEIKPAIILGMLNVKYHFIQVQNVPSAYW